MSHDSAPTMKGKAFTPSSLEEKLATGGFLTLRDEFRRWSGLCVTSIYQEISRGNLKLSKIGRKAVIAAPDALAWRDRKRGIS
jgi:hypothetical protein